MRENACEEVTSGESFVNQSDSVVKQKRSKRNLLSVVLSVLNTTSFQVPLSSAISELFDPH